MKILKIDNPETVSNLTNTHPLSLNQTADILESKTSPRVGMRKLRSESEVIRSKVREQFVNDLPFPFPFDKTSENYSSGEESPIISSSEEKEYVQFCIKMIQYLRDSQVHEQSGELKLALEDVGHALELLDQMPSIWKGEETLFTREYNHFTLRKGAILLALGRTEEAAELLRNLPPKDVATALLYRFIEQKFHVQLLSTRDLIQDTNEEDYIQRAESLFLAGHYDEADLLLKGKTYGGFLRCACLTMLGRMEEAQELYQKEILKNSHFERDTPDRVMFHLLHNAIPDEFMENILRWQNWECMNQFPIIIFWTYSD